MKARTIAWLAAILFAVIAASPSAAQDADFGRYIALIRGHLLTGDELVAQGKWDAARPHFSFPTEEIYGVIREQVRSNKVAPFDGDLRALVRTVKDRNARQFPKARAKVETALAAADAALKARQANWPGFVVAEAIAVLKTASDEYDDAIGTGRRSATRPRVASSCRQTACSKV